MRHYDSSAVVAAPVDQVFAHLDDFSRLSSHMSESSWKMGGGKMQFEFDKARCDRRLPNGL